MSTITRLISVFRAPQGTDAESPNEKTYGWVKYNHLKPYYPDVEEIGIYDPDLLRIALKRFIEESKGTIGVVRIAMYPHYEAESPYLMFQDAETTEPDRWFCISPKQWIDNPV
jgi:hypothetical protein